MRGAQCSTTRSPRFMSLRISGVLSGSGIIVKLPSSSETNLFD